MTNCGQYSTNNTWPKDRIFASFAWDSECSIKLKLKLTKSDNKAVLEKENAKGKNSKRIRTNISRIKTTAKRVAIGIKGTFSDFISVILIFNIIITNRNKTAIAPT